MTVDGDQIRQLMQREADMQARHEFAGRVSHRPNGVTTYCSCGAAFRRETGNPDDDVTAADVALSVHRENAAP